MINPESSASLMEQRIDHVQTARQRARQVLTGESHLGSVDDWRHAIVNTRDAVILLFIIWCAGHAASISHLPAILISIAIALAIFVGISTARATLTQVQYYAAELDRERDEIQNDFPGEKAEVYALYAAKGFTEPLLTQVVDTLVADDDRLLKLMMEEELGLSMHHVNHPLLVGLWNFTGVITVGAILVIPLFFITHQTSHISFPATAFIALTILSWLVARTSGRGLPEVVGAGVITAILTGGTAYWLTQWLSKTSP